MVDSGNWKYKSESSNKGGQLYSLGPVSMQLTPLEFQEHQTLVI